jgi:hypothetical protein
MKAEALSTKELVDYSLLKVLQWIEQTKDFAVEQAPLLAQETLRYGLWTYSAGATLGVVFLACAAFMWVLFVREVNREAKRKSYGEEVCGPIIFVASIATLAGVITCVLNMVGMLQIYLAPRLYLLEQFAGLAGGG